jgi:thiol:disulfide interchange protein DsbA
MQKKITSILLGMLAVGLLTAMPAMAFDEGVDYKTVAIPQTTETPGKIEVLEIFWYGCPHCYHIEADTQKWLATASDSVAFRRMPAPLNATWTLGAKVFYAAEVLGVLERIHVPLFKAIHENRLPFNKNSLADWFASQGVPREQFLQALGSFAVDGKVRHATRMATDLRINGVPIFLVNGKYLTGPSMTGSVNTAFEVINALVAQEAKLLATQGQ